VQELLCTTEATSIQKKNYSKPPFSGTKYLNSDSTPFKYYISNFYQIEIPKRLLKVPGSVSDV
jgi:hypothetical protein